MTRHEIISNVLEAVVFDRCDRTWVALRPLVDTYPRFFFSRQAGSAQVPVLLGRLARLGAITDSRPLVEVGAATEWECWPYIPAPIAEYLCSARYEADVAAAMKAPS